MACNYCSVGERLRKVRLEYKLTLAEVAEATGFSQSFLSLLENGKVTPSLKALDKLCSFYSIHMAMLFEEDTDSNGLFVFRKESQIEVVTEGEKSLRFLLPKTGSIVEPVLVTISPHSTDCQFTVHKGIEYGYVLSGTITLEVSGKDPVTCYEGDSVIYDSTAPHRLLNLTDQTAQGIWIGVTMNVELTPPPTL